MSMVPKMNANATIVAAVAHSSFEAFGQINYPLAKVYITMEHHFLMGELS